MVRVTIGGKKAEFSSLAFVKPETWSPLGKEIRKTTVMSLYNVKVEQKRNLVGKTIRSTTLSKYLATTKRVSDFIQYQYNKEDLPVKDVDFQFVTDYEVYLRSVCNCGHNSCVKHLRYLKQIISTALKNRYITNDPFDDYKLGYKPVKKEFLMLTKGISIESVSKMLGHTNITTTQIYAKVLNQKIFTEVNKVRIR